MLVQSLRVGKSREIYTQLSVEQAARYDIVKDIIIKGYEYCTYRIYPCIIRAHV